MANGQWVVGFPKRQPVFIELLIKVYRRPNCCGTLVTLSISVNNNPLGKKWTDCILGSALSIHNQTPFTFLMAAFSFGTTSNASPTIP